MNSSSDFQIRLATPPDISSLAHLRAALWPESPRSHHEAELRAVLSNTSQRVYPLFVFVAEKSDGTLVGFLETNLRSTADGCDEARPVGYVEGWFVDESYRGRGIGRALLQAAEDWARTEGCTEIASDTGFDNRLSQLVHEASGFTVSAHAILYKKRL